MIAAEPLRLMFLLNSFEVGGTELNAVRTAERLNPARVELSVAAFRPEGPLLVRYQRLGIAVHQVSIPNLYGPAAWVEARRFARLMQSRRIEVLHTHDVYCNIFGVPAGRLAGVRGVMASRRWWKRVPRPGLLVPNRLAYALAHRVLVNSRAVGEMLHREERLPERKITVVPNFIEAEAFEVPAPGATSAWRAERGIPERAVLLGSVGRLAAVKDNATFLRAAARVEDVHVVLVGDGPERLMLEALSRDLGLSSRVHFAGEQPNRPNPHHFFDVSVLCSLSEGFPNSMLEAMAASRAVVATPVGGVTDALVDGENGLLFPPGDVDALAAAFSRIADPSLRARLGSAACGVARRDYGEEPVLHRLTSLYGELASRTLA